MQPIEHKLTPAEAQFFKESRDLDIRLQEECFAALGRAKDAELRAEANVASRNQQLQIIVKNARLPAGRIRIAADNLTLIVEPVAEVAPPAAPPVPAVNGQAALNQ